jgi:hypothetical protein
VVWLGNGVSVCVGAVVEVGTGEDVTINVAVGVEKSGVMVSVFVGVDELTVLVLVGVMVMAGVLVGTFGTQSS